MKWIALVSVVALTACGADGAPFVPTASGNVTVGTGGVQTSTTVGATNGTVSVGIGL